MLTDDDIKAIMEIVEAITSRVIAEQLQAHGLKKPVERQRSLNAERQRRFRERNAARNANVTRAGGKRNGKRNVTVTHITFDWDAFAFVGITADDMKRWQEAYPAIAVPDLIDRAAIWLKANPKNRKSNYERFLTGWLTRAQDRAGRAA